MHAGPFSDGNWLKRMESNGGVGASSDSTFFKLYYRFNFESNCK